MEIWKDIEGYEGLYQVSNLGRVKSLERITYSGRSYGKRVLKERILKSGVASSGYPVVVLSKNKKKKTFLVHRLVARTFIPNDESKEEINHIDGNKTNNCISNLEWNTRSENGKHAHDNKLQVSVTKEIHQFDKTGNFVKSYQSITQAANELGLSINVISANLRGNLKTAGGFVWKYADGKQIPYRRKKY